MTQRIICLLSFCLIVCFACKKKEPSPPVVVPTVTTELRRGLPPDRKLINGYFYGCLTLPNSVEATDSRSIFAYARFNDPRGHLMSTFNHHNDNFQTFNTMLGNISVGSLFLNNLELGKNDEPVFYSGEKLVDSSSAVTWKIGGNLSFIPLDQKLPGFPMIDAAKTTTRINRSEDLIINFDGFISNYDSVRVKLSTPNNVYKIERLVVYPAKSATITASEINSVLPFYEIRAEYIAYNYYHRTVNDKLYVFECANKIYRKVSFEQ